MPGPLPPPAASARPKPALQPHLAPHPPDQPAPNLKHPTPPHPPPQKFLLDKGGRAVARYASPLRYHDLELDVYNELVRPGPE